MGAAADAAGAAGATGGPGAAAGAVGAAGVAGAGAVGAVAGVGAAVGAALGADYASIAPVGGPEGGATLVTIVGEGFLAFAAEIEYVRCRWDGGIADADAYAALGLPAGAPPPETIALEHTATRIVCATPPARQGAGTWLNLSLSLNYLPPSGGDNYGVGDFGDTGLHLTLYATPTYTAITPSGGHREGGTVVTIDGYGFDDLEAGAHVTCQFGHPVDNAAYNPKYTISRPRSVTQTRIVCVSPSTKVSDTRQLWVALNDNGVALNGCADPVNCGRNPTATNLNFTYYDPPTVVSVMPQAGTMAHIRLQPRLHMVAASASCGWGLCHLRLQPPLPTVAASLTYGCRRASSRATQW